MEWWDARDNGAMENPSCMTEEQVEALRKQIAAFATICEMLVDMHRRVTAQHDSLLALQGMGFGSIFADPLAASAHKITTRQRWNPTSMQLQILEKYFDQGNGTPSKQKVKEITSELAHHGLITEMNVYNWFQNRRARSKRKQHPSMRPLNMESEVGNENVRLHDKKSKPISSGSDAAANSGVLSPSDDMRSSSSQVQPSIYDSMALNHGGLDLVEVEDYYGFTG